MACLKPVWLLTVTHKVKNASRHDTFYSRITSYKPKHNATIRARTSTIKVVWNSSVKIPQLIQIIICLTKKTFLQFVLFKGIFKNHVSPVPNVFDYRQIIPAACFRSNITSSGSTCSIQKPESQSVAEFCTLGSHNYFSYTGEMSYHSLAGKWIHRQVPLLFCCALAVSTFTDFF